MGNTPQKPQKGFALILMVFLLGLAAIAYLANALNSNMVKTTRDITTSAALAEAKQALIGWSVQNSAMPGTLPCPDTDNSGTDAPSIAANLCLAKIGHLPWQTLGLKDIRDGNGECLWYALTPIYGDAITTANRGANVINSSIPGAITVKDAAGANLSATVNPVIAVIFAPGVALPGQDRSNVGTTTCGGNTNAGNYLDSAQGIDNSTGNGTGDTFIAGDSSSTFNDKLVYITSQDFYQAVSKRMVREILGNVTGNAGAVDYYANNGNNYPCPVTPATDTVQNCALPTGFINNVIPGMQYNALGAWLANNNWFANETYTYLSSSHVKVTLTYPAGGSYTCDANATIYTCSSP